ncbi:MAG: PD-(D/E)XK nuclease family protein [Spirochaetaceae bacterium]|jgi:hypothetical protein|nr:PD-(D/E)XK nuclease family protein [Spirochaetaceae bacterium]
MDDILRTLAQYLSVYHEAETPVFVFPSESSATFWAEKVLSLFPPKTIAKEHFIAWDSFKEKNINVEKKGQKPSNKIIRLLFAYYLIHKNKTEHFLEFLIPNDYAEEGVIFAKTLAAMLPSLKLWRAKTAQAFAKKNDALANNEILRHEYDFLTELEKQYAAFLEDNFLFEPSWEKPPFRDREHIFYLFYPSLIEDFCEYEALLDAPNVHKIPIKQTDDEDESDLLLFESTTQEIKFLVSEIRRLYKEEYIPYEEIFVSVPELETLEPYLKREFYIYNIPANIRLGRTLAEYNEGLLWTQINDCAQNNFSFTSIRAVLFNFALPWRTPNKNAALIKFAIKNNCVSGYREKGKKKDIMEEAFWGKEKKKRLFNHYKKLKKYFLHIANAKDFQDMFQWTHRFIQKFFTKIDQEDNNTVLGRILRELQYTKDIVAEITENHPERAPISPLGFFIGVLKERTHVKDENKTGVQVFPYGVAAASPARAHFIINVNQKTAAKLYRPLAFLRGDSRKTLNIEDVDISKDFFKSFKVKAELDENKKNYIYFTASSLTYSGWVLPHSYFDRTKRRAQETVSETHIKKALPPSADLFSLEKEWWAHNETEELAGKNEKNGEKKLSFFDSDKKILAIQKSSFNRWSPFAVIPNFNLLKNEFPREYTASTLIQNRINAIKRSEHSAKGMLRVSPTSLKNFFTCQVYWLFREILKIEEYNLHALLLDDINKGLLYHEILQYLFTGIQENGNEGRFDKSRLEDYYLLADSAAKKVTRTYPAFRGPLARPLLGSMAEALSKKIKNLLSEEAENFDGWIVSDLEKEYLIKQNNIIFHGFIDRVSLSSTKDSALIVDYKTGTPPSKIASTGSRGSPLSDFQIASYIKLYEASSNIKVFHATFFSINGGEFKKIIKDSDTREGYQKTIESLDNYIDYYVDSLLRLDFVPRNINCDNDDLKPDFLTKAIPLNHCYKCIYKNICRTTYSLNAGD